MALDPVFEGRVHDGLAGGTDGDGLLQGPAELRLGPAQGLRGRVGVDEEQAALSSSPVQASAK